MGKGSFVFCQEQRAKKARNLPDDFFARELDLCEQMIHLLPTKIHHVRTTGGVLEDF